MKFTVVSWMVMQAEAVVTREAEFAGPAWMFGSRSYQVLPDGRSVHQPTTIVGKDLLGVFTLAVPSASSMLGCYGWTPISAATDWQKLLKQLLKQLQNQLDNNNLIHAASRAQSL